MRILLVGSGAREHALCWAIKKSPLCRKLFCAPGNYGISQLAEIVPIAISDIDGLVDFAVRETIDLVVIGPELPLVSGLADRLRAKKIRTFGPNQAAAQLEGSKGFVKDLCRTHQIPTASYTRVYSLSDAQKTIASMSGKIVVKADGLAAGKGVIIAESHSGAMEAAQRLLGNGDNQHASLVIEEFLDGEEASFFALVDGETVVPLCAAQDHKRAFDGDRGPNTGGMGAYSPAPAFTPAIEREVMERIILPTARAMKNAGTPFSGVLFAGLMLTATGAKLIEYNARFGDPECQAILPRLDGDWLALLYATASGELDSVAQPKFLNKTTLGVVLAANGYPEQYERNTEIHGLDKLRNISDVHVFHAATKQSGDKIIADGGRVLSVVGEGANVQSAQQKTYAAIDLIDWPGGFCRRDIGWRAIAREKSAA